MQIFLDYNFSKVLGGFLFENIPVEPDKRQPHGAVAFLQLPFVNNLVAVLGLKQDRGIDWFVQIVVGGQGPYRVSQLGLLKIEENRLGNLGDRLILIGIGTEPHNTKVFPQFMFLLIDSNFARNPIVINRGAQIFYFILVLQRPLQTGFGGGCGVHQFNVDKCPIAVGFDSVPVGQIDCRPRTKEDFRKEGKVLNIDIDLFAGGFQQQRQIHEHSGTGSPSDRIDQVHINGWIGP